MGDWGGRVVGGWNGVVEVGNVGGVLGLVGGCMGGAAGGGDGGLGVAVWLRGDWSGLCRKPCQLDGGGHGRLGGGGDGRPAGGAWKARRWWGWRAWLGMWGMEGWAAAVGGMGLEWALHVAMVMKGWVVMVAGVVVMEG